MSHEDRQRIIKAAKTFGIGYGWLQRDGVTLYRFDPDREGEIEFHAISQWSQCRGHREAEAFLLGFVQGIRKGKLIEESGE